MRDTNRSLWIAILSCMAMAFYAKSAPFTAGYWVFSLVFFLATLALSAYGFRLGWRAARQQRSLWAWLAPGINAFIFVVVIAFSLLLLRAG